MSFCVFSSWSPIQAIARDIPAHLQQQNYIMCLQDISGQWLGGPPYPEMLQQRNMAVLFEKYFFYCIWEGSVFISYLGLRA